MKDKRIEEQARNLWSDALDIETERRYGMSKHHPPEDCPEWFIEQVSDIAQQQVQEAVGAERKRIQKWAIEQRDDIVHQITKHGEVDPKRTSYAQLGRKTVLNDLLDEVLIQPQDGEGSNKEI